MIPTSSETISTATCVLCFLGNSFIPFADMMHIWFSSDWKQVPVFLSEFNTMKSRFLRDSFCFACSASSFVSRAKPTSRCPDFFIFPISAAISCVGLNDIVRLSFPRLILFSATVAGRKSATAAHNIAASHPLNSVVAALFPRQCV